MTRTSALAALLFLSLAAGPAAAQAPSTQVEPRIPGVGAAPGKPADASATPARVHDDADARACLEFLTNAGVIRCAEKYRHARPPGGH